VIDWLVDLSRLNSGVHTQGALGTYAPIPPVRKIRKFFVRNLSIIYAYILLLTDRRGLWSWKGSKTLTEQIHVHLSGLLCTVLVLYNGQSQS